MVPVREGVCGLSETEDDTGKNGHVTRSAREDSGTSKFSPDDSSSATRQAGPHLAPRDQPKRSLRQALPYVLQRPPALCPRSRQAVWTSPGHLAWDVGADCGCGAEPRDRVLQKCWAVPLHGPWVTKRFLAGSPFPKAVDRWW